MTNIDEKTQKREEQDPVDLVVMIDYMQSAIMALITAYHTTFHATNNIAAYISAAPKLHARLQNGLLWYYYDSLKQQPGTPSTRGDMAPLPDFDNLDNDELQDYFKENPYPFIFKDNAIHLKPEIIIAIDAYNEKSQSDTQRIVSYEALRL